MLRLNIYAIILLAPKSHLVFLHSYSLKADVYFLGHPLNTAATLTARRDYLYTTVPEMTGHHTESLLYLPYVARLWGRSTFLKSVVGLCCNKYCLCRHKVPIDGGRPHLIESFPEASQILRLNLHFCLSTPCDDDQKHIPKRIPKLRQLPFCDESLHVFPEYLQVLPMTGTDIGGSGTLLIPSSRAAQLFD